MSRVQLTKTRYEPRGKLVEISSVELFDKVRHCSNPRCRKAYFRRAQFICWDWELDVNRTKRVWKKYVIRLCADDERGCAFSYLANVVKIFTRPRRVK